MLLQFVISTKGLKPTIHLWQRQNIFKKSYQKKVTTAYGVFSQLRNNLISREHFADGQTTLVVPKAKLFSFLEQSQGSET